MRITLTPSQEDSYYLAVPYEVQCEGSYGKRGDGSERPASLSACRQRVINACPF
ncbi:MAG TPA: hypothetical protein VFV75_15720 [Candidatus Polarisedimenticolaceae bacterium]|nr:hypothetical protein [Candidatus Polarisedimenticolaceae bacterium]